MRVLPNMTVIVPAGRPETLQAIEAVAEHKGPCYVRVGRNKVPTLFDENYTFKIGKAHVFNAGKDAAIIATGLMVAEAIKARDLLKAEGIDAGVINMSTIKPLDADAVIAAAKHCGAIVTAEEHSIIGGLGGAVAEVLAESAPVPWCASASRTCSGPPATRKGLLKHYGMSAGDIAAAVREVIKRNAEKPAGNSKSQAAKSQISSNSQTANAKRFGHWSFEFGIYLEFGYCNLRFDQL